jgi:hypothetical protein
MVIKDTLQTKVNNIKHLIYLSIFLSTGQAKQKGERLKIHGVETLWIAKPLVLLRELFDRYFKQFTMLEFLISHLGSSRRIATQQPGGLGYHCRCQVFARSDRCGERSS